MSTSDNFLPETPMDIDNVKIDSPKQRKYLPTLGDLVDRLSILQLKEIFIKEHKEEYAKEIQDILYDIDIILEEGNYKINARTIRAISLLSQTNLSIWLNESNIRKGISGENNLILTHGINSCRGFYKNIIQEITGGRTDLKLDCAKAAEDYVPLEFKDLLT